MMTCDTIIESVVTARSDALESGVSNLLGGKDRRVPAIADQNPDSRQCMQMVRDDDDDLDDVQIVEPVAAAGSSVDVLPPATKDGATLSVFKVSHKAPSNMKRPLSAVDNVRHGDIAVHLYSAFQHQDEHGRQQIQLCRMANHDVKLLRVLGASRASGVANLDSMVMQKMLGWDNVGSVPVDTNRLGLHNEHALNLVEDMVQARAFLGSGRPYVFHGTPPEEAALQALHDRGFVTQATMDPGRARRQRDGDDSCGWFLTQKTASMLEAGLETTKNKKNLLYMTIIYA